MEQERRGEERGGEGRGEEGCKGGLVEGGVAASAASPRVLSSGFVGPQQSRSIECRCVRTITQNYYILTRQGGGVLTQIG